MDFKLKKSDLNFRVCTASSLPEIGQENDIVVISDVPMTNWILSPNAPGGIPRNDGDVWIQYSVTGNTMTVLKNNIMMIAMMSASQYVDGAWVRKEAKNYKNGAWVDWFPEGALYYNGTFTVPVVDVGHDTRYPGTHSLGDGYFMLSMGTAGYATILFTDTKIDLTDFNTMTVKFNSLTPVNDKAEVMLCVNDEQNGDTPVASIQMKGVASGTVTLDISTLIGSYYPAISIYNTGKQETKFTEWRLNK